MESNKKHRFESNPKEKELHDKFRLRFLNNNRDLSVVVFGWNIQNDRPKDYLTEKGEEICINLIQWLGSPVGQGFLEDCGFVLKDKKS